MKLKLFTAGAVASLLLFASCDGGNVTGKDIKEAGVSNMTDSISYYEGYAVAYMYEQMAQQDTTLKTDAGRAEFMKGMRAAMELFDGKSDAYIAGLTAGMQVGMTNKDAKDRLELNINNGLLMTGMAYAIQNDSITKDPQVTMQKYQELMQRVTQEKQKRDHDAAVKEMASLAHKGYTASGEGMMVNVSKPGSGEALKEGDRVNVKLQLKEMNGKAVKMPPLPEEVVVGRSFGFDSPMAKAIATMKMGETATFAFPAVDVFQDRTKQYGLESNSVLLFEVSAISLVSSEPANNAAPLTAAPATVQPVK